MSVEVDVIAQATSWRDQDPDEETRAELTDLIDRAGAGDDTAVTELHSRFDERLAFGTAGLRGEIAAGPARMNRVLVSQAAAGLADHLLAVAHAGVQPSVVIGYDGRRNSRIFAEDSAQIMAGAGVRAILLPRLLPTPVLAFAVRHLGVSAGVMVTASHNPPNDNGYKVYLGGDDQGSQIVPPSDGLIAARILAVAADHDVRDLPRGDYEIADEAVVDAYVAATASVARGPVPELTWVYTAMHGVGWETAARVFEAAGIVAPVTVDEQIAPDAAFPTVAFPNPEEPGAMDLSYATARRVNAELIIANDPDADRLAVAIPDAASPDGYRRLSGNEVGALLGWRAAEHLRSGDHDGTLAASVVSSPALAEVARQFRLDYVDTLTGFKWVSRVGGLAYGYEEALGYLVNPGVIRDKDGISAATDLLSLVGELKARGSDLVAHQRAFDERFGAFASAQVSLRFDTATAVPRVMATLRERLPSRLGERKVEQVDDFVAGFGSLPPTDLLRLWCEDGSRVILRPSGTEPKLKAYIDASSTDGTAEERRAAATAAVVELETAVRALLSVAEA